MEIINKKVFFLAVNTGFIAKGLPDNRCIEFYRERSGNGIYCSIVGNVVIPNGYGTNNVCATISGDDVWKELTSAISGNGTKPGIQLSATWNGYEGIRKFVASRGDDPISDYKRAVENITFSQITNIVINLRLGIELAVSAGFKHVQIHAAHGYLFSLLIDHEFCKFSSLFQKELESIAHELRVIGIESSIRFSLVTGAHYIDKKRGKLIEQIMKLPFDFFDPSFGFYNVNKNLIYPVTDSALKSRRNKTIELANNYINRKIILSGKSNAIHGGVLPDNVHIGLCRDLIANPNYLQQIDNGCKNHGCCHYYSNGKSFLSCGNLNNALVNGNKF